MSNNSVSPSGDSTFAIVSVYIASIALTSFSGIPYARRILNLPQCIVSKAVLKSIKIIMAERFLSLMPSINRLRAKIWIVVVLPGLNPFWFILM